MNEMQLQRVYDELYDVGDRLARLNSFLDEGGAEAAGVTGKARDLLVEQRFIMRAYYDVLNRRIDEEKKARARPRTPEAGAIRGVSKDESRLRKLERMEDELRALKRRD